MKCNINVKVGDGEVKSQSLPFILKMLENKPHLAMEVYNGQFTSEEDFELYAVEDINQLTEEDYEEAALTVYKEFETDSFKELFGDWTDNKNFDKASRTRVLETGEPKLFKHDALNKTYVLDKNWNKVFIPVQDSGLEYIYTAQQIKKGINYLTGEFFKANATQDYDDIGFVTKETLSDFIKSEIEGRVSQLRAEEDVDDYYANALEESLLYIDDWVKGVREHVKTLNLKITDSDIESETEEESGNSELIRVSALEKDALTTVSGNIKALFSFIQDPVEVDEIFQRPLLVDADKIMADIRDAVADITVIYQPNGDVYTVFDQMVDKLTVLSEKKSHIAEVVHIVTHPTFGETKRRQFTQVALATQNFFVSEMEVNERSITHRSKNVSEGRDQSVYIRNSWSDNFQEIAVKESGINTDKLIQFREDITSTVAKHNSQRGEFDVDSTLSDTLIILNNMGITANDYDLYSYMNGSIYDADRASIDRSFKDIMFSLKEIINNTLKEDTKLKDIPDIFKSESILLSLSNEVSFHKPTGVSESIRSSGKTYWKYTYPSYLNNTINNWKNDISKLESIYESRPGMKQSQLVKYLLGYDQNWISDEARLNEAKVRLTKFKLGVFNVIQNSDGDSKDPKSNLDMAKTDAIVDSLNKALASNISTSESSIFNTPTPADKSTQLFFQHDMFIKTNIDIKISDNSQLVIPDTVVDMYYGYFKAEYDRAVEAKKEIEDPEFKNRVYYHADKNGNVLNKDGRYVGNAFKSQLFPSLNSDKISKNSPLYDILWNEDGSPALTSSDQQLNAIKPIIRSILQKQVKDIHNKLIQSGVFEENTDKDGKLKAIIAKGVDGSIQRSYKDFNYPTLAMAADYFVNTSVNFIEYSKMFAGDPAYYKNMVDYAKRIPATYTDGLQLSLESAEDQYFKAAIISGVEVASPYMDKIIEVAGADIAKAYEGVNTTDAQAWITPQRWKFLKQRLGQWSDLHEKVFNKMLNNEAFTDAKELKLVAQPLKGVYFEINNNVPVYLKYSQAVLLPSLVKGTPMQKILDRMNDPKDPIDELITLDGIKAGSPVPNTIHNDEGLLIDDFKLEGFKLLNNGWKMQQNLPTKTFKNTDVGSQIQKNVLSGLDGNLDKDFILNGENVKGSEIYKGINDIVSEMSNKGLAKFKKEFGIDSDNKIKDVGAFYKMMIEDARKKNLDSNLIQALEKEVSIYGIPQSMQKLNNMIFSIIKDRVIKIKTNGGSFIQVANFGIDRNLQRKADGSLDYENIGVKWFIDPENGLKPPRFESVGLNDIDSARYDYLRNTIENHYNSREGNESLEDSDEFIIADGWEKVKTSDAQSITGYKAGVSKDIHSSLINKDGISIDELAMKLESSNPQITYDKANQIIIDILTAGSIGAFKKQFQNSLNNNIVELETEFENLAKKKNQRVIKPGQMLLPGSLLTKYIPNWKEIPAPELKKMIDPEILENIIGYRIPNQGLSSNDALEIVGFLPEGMGDAVIAYSEIPTKTGSDFDIDKMFMMIPSFSFEGGKLTYIKSKDDTAPLSEDSEEILGNKLIEHYKAVFTHPDVAKEVLTPIDFDFVKDHIVNTFKSPKESDLSHYNPLNQIDLKYDFAAGKAGIGMTANMLVDHIRGLFYDNTITSEIGGRVSTLKLDIPMSRKLSTEDAKFLSSYLNKQLGKSKYTPESITQFKVSHSISAFLNAFVDIAKDPYVTRGNWNTITSNVGFTMLRSGEHPFKVNLFIGQPILKEYVEFSDMNESKLINNTGGMLSKFEEYYTTKHGLEKEVDGYNIIGDYDARTLVNIMDSNNPKDQFQIFKLFERELSTAKYVADMIKASKPDVDGPGKGPTSRLVYESTINNVMNHPKYVSNFSHRLKDTLLGTYTENSIFQIRDILQANPDMFTISSGIVEERFQRIAKSITGEYLTSQNLADSLYSNFYNFMMAGYNPLKDDKSLSLFKTLAKDIKDYMSSEEYVDNEFLNTLEFSKDEGYEFITISNKEKSKDTLDNLYLGWKDLMIDNSDLAIKLIKYSFHQSGFSNNMYQFFKNIPHEYFTSQNFNEYILQFNKAVDEDMLNNFEDQFFRNNWESSTIVPFVNEDNIESSTPVSFTVTSIDEFGGSIFSPAYLNKNGELYKQVMDDGATVLYVKSGKLGAKLSKATISEYNPYENIENSQLVSNNIDTSRIEKIKEEFYDDMFYKTSIDGGAEISFNIDADSGNPTTKFNPEGLPPIEDKNKNNCK